MLAAVIGPPKLNDGSQPEAAFNRKCDPPLTVYVRLLIASKWFK